jgi:protein involved in polysaccharide export with SLBB domain
MKRVTLSRHSLFVVLTGFACLVAISMPPAANAQPGPEAAAPPARGVFAAPPGPVTAAGAPSAPATVAGSITSSSPEAEGYILGAGDRVRVIVFGEPTLSGEFSIDSTGRVALPLVGEIKADGLSLRAFERAVQDLLKVDYLKDPRVSAEVLNFRPFYILGEVTKPGTYPYTSGLTVLNAVVTAGGFTYRANKGSVKIQHQGADKEADEKLTPGLGVQPGDTITIKERWF